MAEFGEFYDFTEENEKIIKKYFLSNKYKNLNITKEDLQDFEIVEVLEDEDKD